MLSVGFTQRPKAHSETDTRAFFWSRRFLPTELQVLRMQEEAWPDLTVMGSGSVPSSAPRGLLSSVSSWGLSLCFRVCGQCRCVYITLHSVFQGANASALEKEIGPEQFPVNEHYFGLVNVSVSPLLCIHSRLPFCSFCPHCCMQECRQQSWKMQLL